MGVALGLAVLATPLVVLALDDGSSNDPHRSVEVPEALARVRAAVGQTAAAGSYEMDTETGTSSPGNQTCVTTPIVSTANRIGHSASCSGSPERGYTFVTHSIVNFEPYAMVAESETPFGHITLHVSSDRVWQKNGLNVGYVGDTAPGVPIESYSDAVLGTLGPGPGALAMISIASRGGHLDLEEAAVASAEPAGTGTVRDVPVTYYDVNIDVTKLADAPDLNAGQRATIEAALPILERSGYQGTTERIGIDDAGFVREVTATTTMGDGSTTTRHSVLFNFGCAPRVTMPTEPPAGDEPLGPCLPDTTVTTTTSSSVPVTTAPATSPSSSLPPSTPPTTVPAPTSTSVPVTTTT